MSYLTLPGNCWPERASFPAKSLFFFDFDGVLIEPTEEKLYQLDESEGERERLEELARSVGVEPSIFSSTQYLRHLVFQALYEGPSSDTLLTEFARELVDPYFIITARSGRHAMLRMLKFVEYQNLRPQEIFCLGRSSKGEHLRHMLKAFPDYQIVFFDDTQRHIDAAVAVGDPRLTPILVTWDKCVKEAETLRWQVLVSPSDFTVLDDLRAHVGADPALLRRLYMCEYPPHDHESDSRRGKPGLHPALQPEYDR